VRGIDGIQVFTVDGNMAQRSQTAWNTVIRASKFILLNVAVRGAMPDHVADPGGMKTPTDETAEGVRSAMEVQVKYVAVFST